MGLARIYIHKKILSLCYMVKIRSSIRIYCRCAMCGCYFDVSETRRMRYCGRSCRERCYRGGGVRVRKLSLGDRGCVVADYLLGMSSRVVGEKWGISSRMVLNYVKASGVVYRCRRGRKGKKAQ